MFLPSLLRTLGLRRVMHGLPVRLDDYVPIPLTEHAARERTFQPQSGMAPSRIAQCRISLGLDHFANTWYTKNKAQLESIVEDNDAIVVIVIVKYYNSICILFATL